MNTDTLTIVGIIVSITVPIAAAIWYIINHPRRRDRIRIVKTASITAGIMILLLGTTFLAGYIFTPSGRVQVTPTPTQPANAEGVVKLLQHFCTSISAGNYAAAYDDMTDDLKAYWSKKQELERWVACTPPQVSQVTLQSSLASTTIPMYDGAGNGPHRQLTLSYSGQKGWKISDYR